MARDSRLDNEICKSKMLQMKILSYSMKSPSSRSYMRLVLFTIIFIKII